jgi:hypothetical protein
VRVDHDAGLLGLPEDLGQPDHWQRPGGQQVGQHLPGADRRQLVHVPDQQQVRPRVVMHFTSRILRRQSPP